MCCVSAHSAIYTKFNYAGYVLFYVFAWRIRICYVLLQRKQVYNTSTTQRYELKTNPTKE